MNFLEKLLDGVAVEWKLLGEIATVTIGEFVHKNKQDPSAKYPVYNGGTSHTGFYDQHNNTGNKVIVSARGANAGFVNKISKPYWAGNSCYSIGIKNAKELNWSFVYYFMKLSENKLIGEQQKGGIPAVSKKQMETFQIPIPCPENPDRSLAIQAEIVRILDTFTALTAELTAELTDRKKQYNYYRDRLLSFEEGEVEWKPLGTLATFSQGIQVDLLNQFTEKRKNSVRFLRIVDFVKYDEVPRYIENPGQRYLKEVGHLVMIRYGASAAGKVFLSHSGAIANNMFKINLTTEKITTKFLYAYLSQPKIYNHLNSNGGT